FTTAGMNNAREERLGGEDYIELNSILSLQWSTSYIDVVNNGPKPDWATLVREVSRFSCMKLLGGPRSRRPRRYLHLPNQAYSLPRCGLSKCSVSWNSCKGDGKSWRFRSTD